MKFKKIFTAGLALAMLWSTNMFNVEAADMSGNDNKTEKVVQTAGRQQLGTFAPEFAHFNDDVLFGENWNNQDIDLKTRSLITVVALMAQGITDSSLKYHITNAKNHGVSQKEMAATITHVAFYAGWPKAWAVFNLAKEVYKDDTTAQ
ncbi:carboxymuconolactone decarboxylase family protein [uncultured Anaerovibrio sp.]|uniref:carboxymuconolactone decarboxylase family protein n=1 Tax=uncultured Anaerovibrio sp. TaxID=361586 RepID=UPI00261EFD82|nr:carboxymuconolactone decarboxylase family protein [uncultured Anaerovibrio sp.]